MKLYLSAADRFIQNFKNKLYATVARTFSFEFWVVLCFLKQLRMTEMCTQGARQLQFSSGGVELLTLCSAFIELKWDSVLETVARLVKLGGFPKATENALVPFTFQSGLFEMLGNYICRNVEVWFLVFFICTTLCSSNVGWN